MTSLSQQRKRIEKRKERTEGKKRKRSLLCGTTPRFPIHTENDPQSVLPQPPGSDSDKN